MLSYLIRRILLFIPTLIGATAVIFLLMAVAPINIVDVLLPPGGAMRPGERAAREAYLQERYGLGDPAVVQYLRWLNNVSNALGLGRPENRVPQVEARRPRGDIRQAGGGGAPPGARARARRRRHGPGPSPAGGQAD